MAEVTFGTVDWNEEIGGGNSKKTDFMRLESNSKNRIRVMANPYQYYSHWLELPNGKRQKINSPVSDPALVKKLEDAGFKRTKKWLVKVLDRSDGSFKLLEIGPQIYAGIKALVNDPDWGSVTSYDLSIDRGNAGDSPLYRVSPKPKSPIDAELKQAFMEFNDKVDLVKLTQPADPDKVYELMGWKASASTANPNKSVADDDDMFDFQT